MGTDRAAEDQTQIICVIEKGIDLTTYQVALPVIKPKISMCSTVYSEDHQDQYREHIRNKDTSNIKEIWV